jgi:hypothetical protein
VLGASMAARYQPLLAELAVADDQAILDQIVAL